MTYRDHMDAEQAKLRHRMNVYMDDFRHWPEDKRNRHRIRRACHELMDFHGHPGYRIGVKDGRLTVGPKEAITPMARDFIANYRNELILWVEEHSENGHKEGDQDV